MCVELLMESVRFSHTHTHTHTHTQSTNQCQHSIVNTQSNDTLLYYIPIAGLSTVAIVSSLFRPCLHNCQGKKGNSSTVSIRLPSCHHCQYGKLLFFLGEILLLVDNVPWVLNLVSTASDDKL